jgi:SAM-dependent methyltransferase
LNEQVLAQFREHIRAGAALQDIHDVPRPVGYASPTACVSEAFLCREVGRVDAHRRSFLPILAHFVGPASTILDVGCGTGGSTIALALSPVLRASEVGGVDPNPRSVDAAVLRAQGHDLASCAVQFITIRAGTPLPFPNASYDLVASISVLEFVSEPSRRAALVREIERVTRPGGHIFIATPSPWRVREYHSRRWFGHLRRKDGYPWSSAPARSGACSRVASQSPSRASRFTISAEDITPPPRPWPACSPPSIWD